MVSILGDYNYTFPKPIPLKLKLKDMLEDNVDEKYYLSDKCIKTMLKHNTDYKPIGLAPTITTELSHHTGKNFTPKIIREILAIKNATKQGYLEATDGDGIDLDYPYSKTICTRDDSIGVIIGSTQKNANSKGYLEATDGDGVDLAMPNSETRRGRVQKEAIQTLTTRGDCVGVCVKGIATNESKEWQKEPLEEKSRTILANKSNGGVGLIDTNLRIRKLTPRECGRLMNVKDEDIDKLSLSDSAKYHIFGDSICTNILMAIFGELLDIDWKTKLEEMLNGNTN